MAAAVADFRPVSPSDTKLSRSAGLEQLNLQPTPDILASVVARDPRPIVVGFAAETAGVDRAVAKAERKNVDLLVYNDISEQGSGFGTDTNRVVLIGRGGTAEELPQLPKTEVASRLWDRIGDLAAGRR
jgi:phosphopantothenoylcysteine decarboxylase/phosphopantothenate--cysteine ligase